MEDVKKMNDEEMEKVDGGIRIPSPLPFLNIEVDIKSGPGPGSPAATTLEGEEDAGKKKKRSLFSKI